MSPDPTPADDPLAFAHGPTRAWFDASFEGPTPVQRAAWPLLAESRSGLLVAPTGSGKTLAAFLVLLDRLLFGPEAGGSGVRLLYVSPMKALGVDVERNLRAPLAGLRAAASRQGVACREPGVGVRTGDTPADERARMLRRPPEILITTPESLYLLLTSRGERILSGVETVIVDEIHAVAGTKRGAHLFLSLERLEALRGGRAPLQRIGLSATQHPVEETRRLLAGGTLGEEGRWTPRDVTLVDAGRRKPLELRVEHEPAPAGDSVWPALHERLVSLIREHRSTLVFANSRRLAERLAAALNEVAGEDLARAHHGSLAREARREIEDLLKQGRLRALVATSTLELGIDMGAIDLVVQVEAPPSIASGLQRIGRAGHRIDRVARGVLLPKHKGDLLAAAASVPAMREARIESTRYPRNALDVLAQQVVAAVAMRPWDEEALFDLVRRAAPYAELPRSAWHGLLDMLSGRYPSHDFEGLRPRVTWHRSRGVLEARRGAHRIAVANAGTIPDRGLYGVFLEQAEGRAHRVGELDEEMVYESRAGDVFLLGASSWRITSITHDRVSVVPAPGEPGRMPFWRGEGPGRPFEMGRAIGALAGRLAALPAEEARALLRREHGFGEAAAATLVEHVGEQARSGLVPTDRRIVVEVFPDEIGDPRVAILSPFGARVHAPWAAALRAAWRREHGIDLEVVSGDDGLMLRLPPQEEEPALERLLPPADELEALVRAELARLPVFAARFREAAARALLLPRRLPGKRSPLWIQRRRSADLLAFASGFPDFPVVLEAYRECLRDVFDLPALGGLLAAVERREIRVETIRTELPSPFAASLGFAYTAALFYENDAPPAERRAHALTVDPKLLEELLGEVELRALLDPDALAEVEAALARRGARVPFAHADDLHDFLLAQGERTREELAAFAPTAGEGDGLDAWLEALVRARRIVEVTVGGRRVSIAAEDAARYRDALGVVLPPGLPDAFLEGTARPLEDLLVRHARTRGPFTAADAARRFGLGEAVAAAALEGLVRAGRLLEGAFRPGGRGREFCDPEVLRRVKRKSLAKVRAGVEPVPPEAFQRFALRWHGIGARAAGPDALLDVVRRLGGAPLVASVLERDVLPGRLERYRPSDLDALLASGTVTWRGLESLGATDGRIALFAGDDADLLAPPPRPVESALALRVERHLRDRGASFFRDVARALGAFGPDVLEALWDLVWAGRVANDTLAPLRSRLAGTPARGRRPRRGALAGVASGSEGRWWAVEAAGAPDAMPSRPLAVAERLLERHGVLTREGLRAEGISFGVLLPVLRALEEAGRVQRGYFVEQAGALQFALPPASSLLRAEGAEAGTVVVLAATDPAQLCGAALTWPPSAGAPRREAGARVVLRDGRPHAWLSPSGGRLLTFPALAEAPEALAGALLDTARSEGRRALLVATIDGAPAAAAPAAAALLEAGFRDTPRGLLLRVAPAGSPGG